MASNVFTITDKAGIYRKRDVSIVRDCGSHYTVIFSDTGTQTQAPKTRVTVIDKPADIPTAPCRGCGLQVQFDSEELFIVHFDMDAKRCPRSRTAAPAEGRLWVAFNA